MRIRLELVPHKSKALGEICQGIWRVPYILLEKEEEFFCVKENEESSETMVVGVLLDSEESFWVQHWVC